ncbi:extracellular solute-binding protein [Rhodococcus pyridinivorans]
MTTKRWRRLAALVLGGALASAVLAGCGTENDLSTSASEDASWDVVVDRANDEGVVNFYSIAPELQNVRLVEAFNEKYPDIKVRVLRGAGDLSSRVSAEIQSGSRGADVFMYSDPAWFTKNADHLMILDGPEAANWADDYWAVPEKSVVAVAAPFGMLMWNTEVFPEGFDSWDDLLDPKVRGQLGTRSDVTPTYAGYLDFLEREMGPDYLPALGKQNPKFYSSSVTLAQAVASGEIGVANITQPATVIDLQELGAPVDAVVPEPGYATKYAAAAVATAHHPNSAKVFLDFVMSQEGQQALSGDGLSYTGRSDVDGALVDEGLDVLDSSKYPAEVLAEWDRKFAEYFH